MTAEPVRRQTQKRKKNRWEYAFVMTKKKKILLPFLPTQILNPSYLFSPTPSKKLPKASTQSPSRKKTYLIIINNRLASGFSIR